MTEPRRNPEPDPNRHPRSRVSAAWRARPRRAIGTPSPGSPPTSGPGADSATGAAPAESGAAPARGIAFGAVAAVVGAALIVVFGGALAVSAGLLVVASAVGYAVGLAVIVGAAGTLSARGRPWIAAVLAGFGVAPRPGRAVALRPGRGWGPGAHRLSRPDVRRARATGDRARGRRRRVARQVTSGEDPADPATRGDLGDLSFRRPTEADHPRVVDVIDDWWGDRRMRYLLPRLWFEHFSGTSWIVERPDGRLAGFVVAFVSQDDPETGYVHMIAAEPSRRRRGLGRALYERAFADLAVAGRAPRPRRDVARQPDVDRLPPRARLPGRRRTRARSGSTARPPTRTTMAPTRIAWCSAATCEVRGRPHGNGNRCGPPGVVGSIRTSCCLVPRLEEPKMIRRLAATLTAVALLLALAVPVLAGGWAEIVADVADRRTAGRGHSRSRSGSSSSSTARPPPRGRRRPSISRIPRPARPSTSSRPTIGEDGHFTATATLPEAGYWSWQVTLKDLASDPHARVVRRGYRVGQRPGVRPRDDRHGDRPGEEGRDRADRARSSAPRSSASTASSAPSMPAATACSPRPTRSSPSETNWRHAWRRPRAPAGCRSSPSSRWRSSPARRPGSRCRGSPAGQAPR